MSSSHWKIRKRYIVMCNVANHSRTVQNVAIVKYPFRVFLWIRLAYNHLNKRVLIVPLKHPHRWINKHQITNKWYANNWIFLNCVLEKAMCCVSPTVSLVALHLSDIKRSKWRIFTRCSKTMTSNKSLSFSTKATKMSNGVIFNPGELQTSIMIVLAERNKLPCLQDNILNYMKKTRE